MGDVLDRNDGSFPYIKVFPEEYLGGSLHYGCNLEERGFFMDILCLAAKNRKERGTLSLEKDIPMTSSMIANALFIPLDECERLLKIMAEQERLSYRNTGVIVITNFEFYQKKYRRSNLQKQETQAVAIKRSEEKRARYLANKYPGIVCEVLMGDFGYRITNKATGEVLETIPPEKESA